jgi:hypothetical protein
MAVVCSLVGMDGTYWLLFLHYFIIYEFNSFVAKVPCLGLYLFLLNVIWWWQFNIKHEFYMLNYIIHI